MNTLEVVDQVIKPGMIDTARKGIRCKVIPECVRESQVAHSHLDVLDIPDI